MRQFFCLAEVKFQSWRLRVVLRALASPEAAKCTPDQPSAAERGLGLQRVITPTQSHALILST